MSNFSRFLGLIALVTLVACGASETTGARSGGSTMSWERDLPRAINRAQSESKLVMVDFYTDWCGWCAKMEQTTYANGRVQEALRAVVPVRLNAEREGRSEARRFRVSGFPMVIFLNSQGREVGRIPGYLPPEPFLQELDDILRRT